MATIPSKPLKSILAGTEKVPLADGTNDRHTTTQAIADLAGATSQPPVVLTASNFTDGVYTILTANIGKVHIFDLSAATGDLVVKIPDATAGTNGKSTTIVFEKGGYKLTVTTVGGSQLIDGGTSLVIKYANEQVSLKDASTKYYIYDDTREISRIINKAEANPSWDASTLPTVSDLVINESTGTLTFGTINGAAISATNPAIYYLDSSGKAVRYLITAPVVFDWSAKTEGVWWFYFDSTGSHAVNISTPPDFGTFAPLYRLYYSAVDGLVNTRAIEFHPNTQSASEHEWKHVNFGTIWLSGFDLVSNPLASGAPATNGLNTCISLTGGMAMDDNLEYAVANNTSGNSFSQDLGTTTAASITTTTGGLFKCSYNDASGRLRILAATRFPFLFSANNIPEYVTGTGVRTEVSNGSFFTYFVYVLQDDKTGESVRIRSAIQQFTTLAQAQAYNWGDLLSVSLTLRDKEIRPLYKLIHEYRSTYNVAVKGAVLRESLDIRKERVKSISASSSSILDSNVVLSTIPSGSTSTNQAGLNAELWDKGSGHTIQENAVSSTSRTKLNYVTSNSEDVIQDDSANDATKVIMTLKSMNDFNATGLAANDLIGRNSDNTGFEPKTTTPFITIQNISEANISANGILSTYCPAGYIIDEIIIKNQTANAAGNVSIGTSSLGTQVVNALTVGASADLRATIGTGYFSSVNDTDLYVSSSAWGTGVITIYFTFKKVI